MDAPNGANRDGADAVSQHFRPKFCKTGTKQHLRNRMRGIVEPWCLLPARIVVTRRFRDATEVCVQTCAPGFTERFNQPTSISSVHVMLLERCLCQHFQ